MQRFFSLDMPFLRFARNTMLLSLVGLVPLLVLFLSLTPGFAAALFEGGPALRRFLRQVATNGLPVVFVVNYVSFFLYAWINVAEDQGPGLGVALFADVSLRLVAFVILHVLIYVLSADWFGSFGGSRATALRVVAPTLARSAFFENISGVYLYATLVSAMPLYVSSIEKWLMQEGWSERVPVRPIAAALAMVLFGAVVLALTAAALLVAELQSGR